MTYCLIVSQNQNIIYSSHNLSMIKKNEYCEIDYFTHTKILHESQIFRHFSLSSHVYQRPHQARDFPTKKKHIHGTEQFEQVNKISNSIQFAPQLVTKSLCLRQFLNLPRDLSFLINTSKSFQSSRAFKNKELNILEE